MRHRARAQVVVWVAVLLPTIFLPVIGLSIDAGVMFDSRRELQNVADAAARAGAMEIDLHYLADPRNQTGEIRLDESEAKRAATQYLDDRAGLDERGGWWDTPDVTASRITVTVHQRLRLPFLRIFNVPTVSVSAVGTARACSGLTSRVNTCVAE